MMNPSFNELDRVRLLRPSGRWPVGTEGTVVARLSADAVTVDFSARLPAEERAGFDYFELVPEVAVTDLEPVEAVAGARLRSS